MKPRKTIDIFERLFRHIAFEPNTGCELWVGGWEVLGYGIIKFRRKPWRAHRLSWLLHRGEIPDGMHVLHKCDTPACVNPNHLFLGDDQTNMDDMARKGRRAFGSRCKKGHLTEAVVAQIKADLARCNGAFGSYATIAKRYGITVHTLTRIRKGGWRHVPTPVITEEVAL